MKLYQSLEESGSPTAVALGCFDGVHLGHRQVIGGAVQGADCGLVPTVFTFDASPMKELCGKGEPMIQTNSDKIETLEQMGIQQVYLIPFSSVQHLTAEEFVDRILLKLLHAQRVCCGFNFHFGAGGKGDGAELTRLCTERKIQTLVTPAVTFQGENISSTRIRRLIESGEMEQVSAMLGRNFSFNFIVVHGRKLGRELGTPTINQVFPTGFILPRFGVYASLVRFDGKCLVGVTNIGVKPTVGSDRVLSETWMPDYTGDLYGRPVKVELLSFLRPEKKFAGIEQLKNAILRDGETARSIAGNFLANNGQNG